MATKVDGLDYVAYESLDTQHRGQRRWLQNSGRKGICISAVVSLILLLATGANIGVWILVASQRRDALDEEWNYCGRTSEEAMHRGCVMEPLFYGWMPRQCVYGALTDRYPVFEDRKWFLEEDLQNEIVPELLYNGTHKLVYTHIYHGEHCLFQWRKVMYAMDHNEPYIDNKTISIHHSSHCADQLTGGREGEHAVNEVEIGFYRCRNTPWAN